MRAHPKPLSIVVDPATARPSTSARPTTSGCSGRRARCGWRRWCCSSAATTSRRRAGADRAHRGDGRRAARRPRPCPASTGRSTGWPGCSPPVTAPTGCCYRDIEDCVDLLTELAHVRRPPRDRRRHVERRYDGLDLLRLRDPGARRPRDPTTVVRRTSFRDAVLSDGEVLVMRDWTADHPPRAGRRSCGSPPTCRSRSPTSSSPPRTSWAPPRRRAPRRRHRAPAHRRTRSCTSCDACRNAGPAPHPASSVPP